MVLPGMSPVLRETLHAGIIQHFEVAYEVCWKSMRQWLGYNVRPEAVDGVSRRELFRLAAEEVFAVAVRFLPAAERFRGKLVGRHD